MPAYVTPAKSKVKISQNLVAFPEYMNFIWASPFINFQENFQPPCFFTYTVIRAYPIIKFEVNGRKYFFLLL